MLDTEVRTAIAELKRRNRAAGKRLSPLESRAPSVQPRRGRQRSIPPRIPPSPSARHANSATPTAKTPLPPTDRKAAGGGRSHARFSLTAPPSSAKRPERPERPEKTEKAEKVERRVPTKPHGPSRPSVRGDARHPPSAAAPFAETPAGRLSPSANGENGEGGENGDDAFVAPAAGGEAERASLSGYRAASRWAHQLPPRVCALLDGGGLEEPHTTNLWTHAAQTERRRNGGHYACVRCHVPIVAPAHQVLYSVRGLAAFDRLNTGATEVRLVGLDSGRGKANGWHSNEPLQLQVRCVCCGGFLGVLVPSTLHGAGTACVFVVNSSCLEYKPRASTRCRLDGTYGDAEDGNMVTSPPNEEIDFDDPDIFEM